MTPGLRTVAPGAESPVARRMQKAFLGAWVFAICAWGVFSGAKLAPAQARTTGDLREKLVLANKILAMEGLVGPFGHVSVRSANEGKFLVAKHESADQVNVADLVEVETGVTPESAKERGLYLEIFIHSSIYEELPEVQAVVHAHSPYAVALGTLRVSDNKILPTTNAGANLGNFIPIFQAVGLIRDPEKGIRVARALQGQNGVLLRGHGTVVVGRTLEQAVLRAIYLELEARTQMASRQAGEPIFYRPDESDLFKDTRAVEHAWDYYVAKVRRHKE